MSEPLILVPLDGSDLAEAALPYASSIAKATGARLLLFTVWGGADSELITHLPDVAEDLSRRAKGYYQEYLTDVAQKLEAAGIQAETEVRIGNPAEEILRALNERDPQLLVLATHGRSGLGRGLDGSG